VQLHDLSHDREPQTEAADLRRRFQPDLLKWFEYLRLEGGRYTDSGVLHDDRGCLLAACDRHTDPSVLGGELHRVGQKIPEHLLETRPIALDQQRTPVGVHVQGQALVRSFGRHRLDAFEHECTKIHGLHCQRELP